MTFCALIQPQLTLAQESSIESLLEQTESLRTIDHSQFLVLLEKLHHQTPSMSPHERWHLRYLDAWQASFQGDYAKADPLLHDVIDHSANAALTAKASAVLMDDLRSNKHYKEAFELANRLAANLPQTQDKLARFMVLAYLSQMLRSAGQYDLAAHYIGEMAQVLPPGEAPCQPMAKLLTVLYESHSLTSSSTELQRGIDTCEAAKEPIFADTIWLVKGSLYLDENKPEKALALLQQITPSIQAAQYYSNTLASQVELAQAYWKLGDDDNARKAALAALAASDPSDISGTLRDAYEVLYRIEKKHGHAIAALAYHEHYVTQDIGYLNDVSARTLAYDMAQQDVLAQKLETEKLSKQNNILQLQQALSIKAVETSRLYIALLLVTLAFIIFWLFRLKRSQLRFKQLSSLDGLTGIFNHQHFMSGVDRTLRLLEKKPASACLVFIDLDHFKQVNDNHGHALGDAVLRRTVTLCKQQLRAGDLFGRLGGEEFGILLQECSLSQGMAIADRIRTAIETTSIDVEERAVSFSASIGLASTETCGHALQRLCKEADAALYRAKRHGRNRVIAHTEDDDLVEA
ncbi:tetratricopeptide repeat-containing diguanylate cyclase [Dyella caseinilytica]|nr:GGDEF domain-containing protein [Dyella caseinilytica]